MNADERRKRRNIYAIASLGLAVAGLLGLLALSIYGQELLYGHGATPPLAAFGSLWLVGLLLGACGAGPRRERNRIAIGAMILNAINLLSLLRLVVNLMRGYLS